MIFLLVLALITDLTLFIVEVLPVVATLLSDLEVQRDRQSYKICKNKVAEILDLVLITLWTAILLSTPIKA